MPELPEVETVMRGLAPVMEGATIARLELSRPDLRFPFPGGFADRVEGARFLSISRRGKYMIAELDNGVAIIMHLGMSGSFRIEGSDKRSQPGRLRYRRHPAGVHDHVIFRMLGDDGPYSIIYNDPRRFGFMDLARSDELGRNRHLAGLGIDPLGNAMSARAVACRVRGRTAPLKAALLDQRLIAGLGNIYVCEALWQARLSPFRPAGTIVRSDGTPGVGCERLVAAIRDVLARAIDAGGSSLRDHRQADGSLGYFQHSFCVYDREGQPCQHTGCRGVIARAVQSARSTFWCAHCQR